MRSSRSTFKCPPWLQYTCCALPLLSQGALVFGAACGVAIAPYVIVVNTYLSWKVITAALNLPPRPLLDSNLIGMIVAARRQDGTLLTTCQPTPDARPIRME